TSIDTGIPISPEQSEPSGSTSATRTWFSVARAAEEIAKRKIHRNAATRWLMGRSPPSYIRFIGEDWHTRYGILASVSTGKNGEWPENGKQRRSSRSPVRSRNVRERAGSP